MELKDLIKQKNFIYTGSERNYILKDIYEIYEKDKMSRKKANWKRYCQWCKENKKENSTENQSLFRKSKLWIKLLTPKELAIRLAHIPTKDLYYMLSVSQDKLNRRESVGGFLLGSIKI